MSTRLSRRKILAAAITSASVVLSGCSQFSDSSETSTPSDGRTPVSTKDTATATETATPTLRDDGESWPMFGYDAMNTRHSPQVDGPTSEPEIVWTADISTSDPATSTYPNQMVSLGGTIYVGSKLRLSSETSAGLVHAVDSSGTVRWRFRESDPFGNPLAVTADGLYAGQEDGTTFAFDSEGDIRWTFDRADIAVMTVADDSLYATAPPGTLLALTPDGELIWEYTREENGLGSITALGDEAVFVSGRSLFAIDKDGGSERWIQDAENTRYHSPVVHDDTIYASTVSTDESSISARAETRKLVAFSASGEQLWQSHQPGYTRCAVAEGMLLVTRMEGVVALDPKSREELWHYDCGCQIPTAVYVGGETAFIPTDKVVHAVDVTTGEQQWRFQFEDELQWSTPLIVVNDRLYVLSKRDTLYALE